MIFADNIVILQRDKGIFMLQELIQTILDFLKAVSGKAMDTIGIWIPISSLVITIITIIIAVAIFKKLHRAGNVKKMIAVLSSLDLLYYSLEKHFKIWKETKKSSPGSEEFWKVVNLTQTVTSMQELKTLSNVYLKKSLNYEVLSLLEFVGDIILISFRGEDISERNYDKVNIITSDDFSAILDKLIEKLSKGLGIKINKIPSKEIIQNLIKLNYIK